VPSNPAGPTNLLDSGLNLFTRTSGMQCTICSGPLKGKQKKFCSRACKNKDTNFHHQSYLRQQERGRANKLRLVEMLGGQCTVCCYRRNYSALEFHHLHPVDKKFQLDMRSLSNMRWNLILHEAKKCILLCANCHAEHHNPNSVMPMVLMGERPVR